MVPRGASDSVCVSNWLGRRPFVSAVGFSRRKRLAGPSQPRAKLLRRLQAGDAAFRLVTLAAAIAVLVLLGGAMIALATGAAPAFRAFGPSFLIDESWNPVTERFGSLAPIYGTLITSLIAMLI